jgi:predicted Zn-dependent peptidase
METMDILKIVLPALLVLLTAYLLIDKLLRSEEKRRNFELRKNSSSTITPIRLRAYERLILVMERTTPATLILNVAKPGMTNLEFHSQLLASIRQEFSHNLSQQIYVSDEVWNYVRSTQESLLQLINMCAAKCNPNDSASGLAELIIQVYGASEQTPTELAIDKLKKEVRNYF